MNTDIRGTKCTGPKNGQLGRTNTDVQGTKCVYIVSRVAVLCQNIKPLNKTLWEKTGSDTRTWKFEQYYRHAMCEHSYCVLFWKRHAGFYELQS